MASPAVLIRALDRVARRYNGKNLKQQLLPPIRPVWRVAVGASEGSTQISTGWRECTLGSLARAQARIA